MARGKTLQEVLTSILTHEGAILERREDDCAEIVSPSSLSKMLGIPEHGILSFSGQTRCEGAIGASYESELFMAVENTFAGKGRLARAIYPPHFPNIEKLSRWVTEKVVLSNAVFRLKSVEHQSLLFLLIFLKYTALSDEKREGVFPLLVNARNHSVQTVDDQWEDLWTDMKETYQAPGGTNEEMLRTLRAVFSAVSQVVKEELDPFIKGLEKRLNRDVKRVFEYYETLKLEAEKAFEKKGLSVRTFSEIEEGPTSSQEESRRKLTEKLDAIEGERRWKIQDLISQYAMKVTVEPVCLIQIETHSPVFWIEMRRRLSTRLFPLTYNPLLKRIDPLPCEACFYPQGGYFLCDEKLHILCSSCFRKCPHCHKEYCPVCHKNDCPRCANRSTH
jgi:hypothetical protein